MNFALETAYKIALIVVALSVLAGLVLVMTTYLSQAGDFIPASIPVLITENLDIGRELVNNFIPAHLFNVCVAMWLAAYPLGFAAWVTSLIVKLLKPE